jgi:DnaA family protein
MVKQLSFSELIPEQKQLNEFVWGENLVLKHHLEHILENADDKFVYIWGPQGCGKSHLLQTICSQYDASLSSIYLPLSMWNLLNPQSLENLEQQDIVCIDDIQIIAQRPLWEEAIFHLFNRIRDQKTTLLIIAGSHPPHLLGLSLPDLCSRLQWGLSWYLKEAADEFKIDIIIKNAEMKGFVITAAVAQYLLSHYDRNLNTLMYILEQVDKASLEAQRKNISVRFLKECLAHD